MLLVCRIRAMKFIDLMRDYFDQTIDFSIASLPKAALFLNAVRDSLTPDCVNLRKDVSPRIARMFKDLLKIEDDDGALKIRDFENGLWQNIMQPLSAWLGEIFRIHCANLEWRAQEETREDGAVVAEPVLYCADNGFTMFPIAFAEKFFYRPDYELNIDDYYYNGVKQFKLAPAVTHEYRFKPLPEDDLPDNILPFQTK